ncbi:MAG: hypothetical protein ER33_12460 [Cyanobium sp. CACIAM 14]|nr:MAG: hypothetical protein ER33_12460 [Cyanobium sp. CACIAM 14]
MTHARRWLVGVMGGGDAASLEAIALAGGLGREISRRGWALLSGGRPRGVMAAVSAAAMEVPGHLVIGVLPGDGSGPAGRATAELDLAVFTGMGHGRNVINVLSSDVVVVCGGGGPGTASEAALALNAGRPLILLAAPEPWPTFFRSLSPTVQTADDVATCCRLIEDLRPQR